MKVLLEYIYGNKEYVKRVGRNGHHYWSNYEKCDLYCPHCGQKTIWEKQGGGDCYLGVDYVCTSCVRTHYLENMNSADEKIVEQLRTGITHQPTTVEKER